MRSTNPDIELPIIVSSATTLARSTNEVEIDGQTEGVATKGIFFWKLGRNTFGRGKNE